MRRGKRIAAAVLATGMAVTGGMIPFAVNDKGLVKGSYGSVTDGRADSVLTGTIKITSIQVKMLIAASFDIDPNVAATADVAVTTSNNQIIAQAGNYTIASTSKVPLVVGITGVKTKTDSNENMPTLASKMDGPTGRNMMFVICKSGDGIKYLSAATDNSRERVMTTTATTNSPCRVTSTAGDNTLAPEDTLSVTLYGAIGAG